MDPIHFSTVKVICDTHERTGSGFLVKGGYLITAAHNITGSDHYHFCLCDERGRFTLDREDLKLSTTELVVCSEEHIDLAIYKIESDLPAHSRCLPIAKEHGSSGNDFTTLGFPDEDSLRAQVIHDLKVNEVYPGKIDFLDEFVIGAGFSGGPIYDKKKEAVIGVILRKHKSKPITKGVPATAIIDAFLDKDPAFDINAIAKALWTGSESDQRIFVIHPWSKDENMAACFEEVREGISDNNVGEEIQMELLSWQDPVIQDAPDEMARAISSANCVLMVIAEDGEHNGATKKIKEIAQHIIDHDKVFLLNLDSGFGKIYRYVENLKGHFIFLVEEPLSRYFFKTKDKNTFPKLSDKSFSSLQKRYFPIYLDLKTKLSKASTTHSLEEALLSFDFKAQKDYFGVAERKKPSRNYSLIMRGERKSGHELLIKQLIRKELEISDAQLATHKVNLADVNSVDGLSKAFFKVLLDRPESTKDNKAYRDLIQRLNHGKDCTAIIFKNYSSEQLETKDLVAFCKDLFSRLSGLENKLWLFFLDQDAEEATGEKTDNLTEDFAFLENCNLIKLPYLSKLDDREWRDWKHIHAVKALDEKKLNQANPVNMYIEDAVFEIYKKVVPYKVGKYRNSICI